MAKKKPIQTAGKAKKTNSSMQNHAPSNWRRLRLGIGVSLVIFSIYLLFSQLSYFSFWRQDFDKVHQFNWHHLNGTMVVDNWGGPLGAWLAHQTIYKTFGMSAIGISYLLLLIGRAIYAKRASKHFFRKMKSTVLVMLWLSLCLGTFIRDSVWSILGGMFGYQSSLWLEHKIGYFGLILFLLLSLILLYIIPFARMGKRLNVWQSNKRVHLQEQKAAKAMAAVRQQKENAATQVANSTKEDRYNTEEFTVKDETTLEKFPETVVNDPHDNILDTPKTPEEPFELIVNEEEEPEVVSPPKSDLEVELYSGVEVLEGKPEEVKPVPEDEEVERSHGIDTPYDPREDLSAYQFPAIDLLKDYGSDNVSVYREELEANKNRIVETLSHYKIQIDKIKATVGPTVTLYEIVPAPGVRISKIRNLEDDIALSLSALGIRIIAPIPGRGSVGIEVPNSNPQIVSMKSVLQSDAYQNSNYELPIVLGKTISNESYVFDLVKMPHLLVAGATGQGKSVGLNAIIASLLYKKHPAELKFVMVDPKKVELTLFSKIERHFLAKLPDSEEAIITDTQAVVSTLYSLVKEMDSRYDLLKDAQVRNIKEYNAKFKARQLNPENGHRFMPYIVLIVDEFADLMMTAGKEVESPIARLAQLARAIGIHLIIATQRPSVNVITGIIKANFPARIAFRVTSRIDSRTILDSGGADQLIGRGDMLMSTGNDMVRLQCAFVDTPEVDNITDFIGSQRAYTTAYILPESDKDLGEQEKDIHPADRDELFEEAAAVIVNAQQGSTSLLQRKLKLGYNRAGRIIDQLEAAGIVGTYEGSKAREVRVADEIALEQFLKDLYTREQE